MVQKPGCEPAMRCPTATPSSVIPTAMTNKPSSPTINISIGHKLLVVQGLLFAVIVVIGAFAFVVLERVVSATERVGTRYAPQNERLAAAEVLMFRISLEARHAMLVTTPEAQRETFARIGEYRSKMLKTMEDFERDVTTERGRAFIADWKQRDALFWRLGG